MDETTKVITATLSGFIIAFFAEPVKNYFQNKSKLQNLRIALYKEMLNNYFVLTGNEEDDVRFLFQRGALADMLRTECYKNAIQNEISLFYQLAEANKINLLYNSLVERIIETSGIKGIPTNAFMMACRTYIDLYTQSFYIGIFDRKIIRGLVAEDQYREIIQWGRKVSEARDNKSLPPTLKKHESFLSHPTTTDMTNEIPVASIHPQRKHKQPAKQKAKRKTKEKH